MQLINRLRDVFRVKTRDCVLIMASSPMCPHGARLGLLRGIGWEIGRNCSIAAGVFATRLQVALGDRVRIGHRFYLDGSGSVSIGSDSVLESGVKVLTTSHPIEPAVRRRIMGKDIYTTVLIGERCRIGAGAMVLPGVRVADGCVIAPGSVVSKDTEPETHYAGVPARKVHRDAVG